MKKNQVSFTLEKAALFASWTLISRLLGFAREILKSYVFGISPLAAIFDIAFRIPNLFRNLFAEGAMTQALLPIYENYKINPKQMEKAIGAILLYAGIFLSLVYIGILLYAPQIISWFVNEKSFKPEELLLSITLTKVLFPYLIFVSLGTIFIATQYSYGIFWPGSFSPALLNILIFIFFGSYCLFMQDELTNLNVYNLYIFTACILIGGFITLLFNIVLSHKHGIRFTFTRYHPILKDLGIMILPAIFSAGLQHVGQFIDIYLATNLETNALQAIPSLAYAQRVTHLPIGIFAIAISTSSLKSLSQTAVTQDWKNYADILGTSMRFNIFLLLPATIGIFIFSETIIRIIYERGTFDNTATLFTAIPLKYYALGIVAYGLQKLFLSALYAQKNTKIPVLLTAVSLLVNVVASISLIPYFSHGGIALGSSVAAYVVAILYYIVLARNMRIKQQSFKKHYWPLLKILGLNAFLGYILLLIHNLFDQTITSLQFFTIVVTAVILYIGMARACSLKELKQLKQIIQKDKK